MSIGDTLAKAVAERDEQKVLISLMVEGWEAERRAHATLKRLNQEQQNSLYLVDMEVTSLRESVRRQTQKLRQADIAMAEARRQIEVLEKRLASPLEGTRWEHVAEPLEEIRWGPTEFVPHDAVAANPESVPMPQVMDEPPF